jgi:hypothetical protein
MIRRKIVLLLTILITVSVTLSAGITRKEAENIVLLQILSDDIGKVDVYSLITLLSSEDKILISDRQLNCPFPQNWVFFVDDFVFANWDHACRYIFVNEANGEYQIVNETLSPLNLIDYEKISEMQYSLENHLLTDPEATIENSREPDDHLYAVIINGGYNPAENDNRFWNNMSAIFCTLTQVYGYKPENIYVHSADGTLANNHHNMDFDGPIIRPNSIDIKYPAFYDDIEDTFENLEAELGSDDQLFVYVTDHGALPTRITLWGFYNR